MAAIPKTESVERMRENLSVFDFELDADDHARMASLCAHLKFIPGRHLARGSRLRSTPAGGARLG